MNCQVYPLKHHMEQACVLFPVITPIDNLPKSVRHEIDTAHPWPHLDLVQGRQMGSLDETKALTDIICDGFHIQHLNPGDEEILRKVA